MGLLISVLLTMQMFGVNVKSDTIILVLLAFFMGPYLFFYSIARIQV